MQLDAGDRHVCGVDRGGRAWCWGDGDRGQLGNGDSVSSETPVPVATDVRFAQVSAGYERTCAVDLEGDAWCWGEHAAPPAGPGLKALTETTRTTPAPVTGPAPRFLAIATGRTHACGLAGEGTPLCWGQNLYGELGNGSRQPSDAPVTVTGPAFTVLALGQSHACGLDRAGAAWCWGQNDLGQLGDGTRDARTSPVQAAGGLRFHALAAGQSHTCAIAEEDAAWCWGLDNQGQLAAGSGEACGSNRCATRPTLVAGGHRFRSLNAGPTATCGLDEAGETWCWGQGWTDAGDLPERAGGDLALTAIATAGSQTCGITALGETRCFGRERDPTAALATLALVGGLFVAMLLIGWERGVVPTSIFAPVAVAISALALYLVIPLYRLWRDLAADETGWFFMLEILIFFLLLSLLAAFGGFLYLVARAWRKRQEHA